MNHALGHQSPAPRIPGTRSLPWGSAARYLLVVLATATVPAAARATTADDLCNPTDDPCHVVTTISVTPGSVIDVGARGLLVDAQGTLSVSSGTMTLRAGQLTVNAGGSLLARGTTQAAGGTIVAAANAISIDGSIDVTGAPGGAVTLTSQGPLRLNGPLDVGSTSSTTSAGSAVLHGAGITVTAAGSVSARSPQNGGTIDVSAGGALAIAGAIDASGGNGGCVTLSALGSLTIVAAVVVRVDATAGGGGSAGDIDASATGDVTLDGGLSATGGSGTVATGGGFGGGITVAGRSITVARTAAFITAAAGGPDGVGGDIALTSNGGDVDYVGQLGAPGPSPDGSGGTVSITATGAATLAGAIDVSGASGGGGELDVSSGGNVTVTAAATLSVAATGPGVGGNIALDGGGAVDITGTLISDGGSGQGSGGGTIVLTACLVHVESSGNLSSLGASGANTLIGRDITVVSGTLRADAATGSNTIRYAGSDYAPLIMIGAFVKPPVALVEDATVVPCNPFTTRTPTRTPARTTPTATANPTGTPTPTATANPAGTPIACVGDCDGSGMVTISELITGVNIALGSLPLSSCPAFDANGDGMVSINELIQAVTNALNGCP